MNPKIVTVLTILVLVNLFNGISGHGMLMDPVNRGSRWRVDGSEPRNYDDNSNYCGGAFVQHQTHGGRCGWCGDNWGDSTPRRHELGGQFGQGVIVKTYSRGSVISVTARLTQNHKGYFYFRVCSLDQGAENEGCFERYRANMPNGAETYPLPSDESRDYTLSIQLPHDLSCNHCVLQWTYVAGNNWGVCPDGSQGAGCGPQEHFRTCSDIRIN